MGNAITINVTNKVTQNLDGVVALLKSAQLREEIGKSAAQLVKAHFANLENTRPNKHGWERQHYWQKAGESTTSKAVEDGAVVSIGQKGIGLHFFGGVVVPKKARMLTIPATEAAYGRGARSFTNLVSSRVDTAKGKRPALVDKTTREPFFWLARKTTHIADRTIIPTEAEFTQAAGVAIDKLLAPLNT